MAFTCPRCGRASHSRDDEREGYCGACRDWTAVNCACAECGHQVNVPPGYAGAVWCPCLSPEPMLPLRRLAARPGDGEILAAGAARGLWQHIGPAEEEMRSWEAGAEAAARYIAVVYGLPPLITGSQRNPGTDSGRLPASGPGRQPEVDDAPWGDSMEWSPGDAVL